MTIGSLLVTSVVSLAYGESLADGVIRNQLSAQLALKADRIERYVASMTASTAALAGAPAIAEAALRFRDAYQLLDDADGLVVEEAKVVEFYQTSFAPELEAVTGPGASWTSLLPSGQAAIYLQANYVVPEMGDPLERRLVDDARDGSAWSEVHRAVHPGLLEVTDRLGVADLYLVTPSTGEIVYSVAKAPDFATSLEAGPYDGSVLANLVRSVRDNPEPGLVMMSDVVPYDAIGGRPTGFLASPVFDDGEMVAILVLEISTDAIDEVMTSEGDWASDGLGDTGETFIVAADGRMRSISRSYIEDPGGYVAIAEAAGTLTPPEATAIRGAATTTFFQPVTDPTTLESADTDPTPAVSYLGSDVFAAYRPLSVSGVEWFVAAQVGRSEVGEPVAAFRKALLIGVAIFVVMVTFGTVAWADRVFSPIRAVSEKLRRIHEGSVVDAFSPQPRSTAEFSTLEQSIDAMLEASTERQAALSAAAEERLGILRSLLPPTVVERVEAGDRKALDQIPQATIVVMLVDGFGDLVQIAERGSERGLLDRLVSELNTIAGHHGVEPVKLVGDGYFAGCGLTHPVLDDTPRCVDFALEALDAMRDIDPSGRLRLSVGIHSGPVTVGLGGSALLVYDLWGETVRTAHVLARSATPGQILITSAAKEMLPPGIDVRSVGPP
ncbi:MAG: adenylate/guanylate cyclase domain-containing protein, partial [Acidimicrobiia bacterium]|nr:adenylate/guanylate cyclase domain-containing protein [Acidimicrobiia bacterium]